MLESIRMLEYCPESDDYWHKSDSKIKEYSYLESRLYVCASEVLQAVVQTAIHLLAPGEFIIKDKDSYNYNYIVSYIHNSNDWYIFVFRGTYSHEIAACRSYLVSVLGEELKKAADEDVVLKFFKVLYEVLGAASFLGA